MKGIAEHSSQIGDLKKSDLPGPEALDQPGSKEGQVKMVKTVGGTVEAYQVMTDAFLFSVTRADGGSPTGSGHRAPARGRRSAR